MRKVLLVLPLCLGATACTQGSGSSTTSCQADVDCASGQSCDPNLHTCSSSGTTGGTTGDPAASQPGRPAAARSQIIIQPASVVADGAASATLLVVARDGSGTLLPGIAVTVSASGSDNVVDPTSGTTNSQGIFSASLTSTTIEPKTVTATLGGFSLQGTVTFTAGPPSLSKSSLTVSPNTVVANGNSVANLTLSLHDAQGNPAAGVEVTFSANGSHNTLLPQGISTDDTGTCTATLASSAAETKTITAHFGGAAMSIQVTFTPGPPNDNASSFTASSDVVLADSISTVDLALVLADEHGNMVPGIPVTLTATGTHNILSPSSGSTNSGGIFSATLASSHAEVVCNPNCAPVAKVVTATFAGLHLDTYVVFLPAPSPLTSSLVASPASVVADNNATTSLTVTVRDGDGNALSGQQVVFGGIGTGDTLSATSGITDSSGHVSATLKSTVANIKHPNATVANFTLNTNVVFTAAPCATLPLLPDVPVLGGGSNPNAVLAADFNGDGLMDLAVVSQASVDVWRGGHPGTFTLAGTRSSGGQGAMGAWAGNIVGDANIDVVVANSNSTTISVLQGVGDGTLQAAVTYAAGNAPYGLALADLNDDGQLDAVVSNPNDDAINILINSGTGTFGSPTAVAVPGHPLGVALGTLNGDGHVDLVVTNNGNDSISVLLGNGNGTFQPLTSVATGGSAPTAVIVGEFTGDANNDVVVANANSSTLSLLGGLGDGTFRNPNSIAVGATPHALWGGDINGDGKRDVVVANAASRTVMVLLGNNNGTFQPAASVATGTLPGGVAVADFNQDGNQDLAVANHDAHTASILLAGPHGTFKGPGQRYPTHTTPRGLASADLNGDGAADFLVANGGGNLTVSMNRGDGTFGLPLGYAAHLGPAAVAVADFNHDGIPDAAVANTVSADVSILLGFGNGALQTPTQIGLTPGAEPVAVAAAVLTNAPGHVDLLVANANNQNVSVLLGDGNGGFATPVNIAVAASPNALLVADFNGDGNVDALTVNTDGNNVTFLANNGNGVFAAAQNTAAGTAPTAGATGLLNNDTYLDVVVTNPSSGEVQVLLGHGDGSFQVAVSIAVGGVPTAAAIADVNADGKTDLLIADAHTMTVQWLKGDGAGSFTTSSLYAADTGPMALTVGDWNLDGRTDVAVVNATADTLAVLLNSGCAY